MTDQSKTMRRWSVYASDGRGKRKDRRIARGWRAQIKSSATCLDCEQKA